MAQRRKIWTILLLMVGLAGLLMLSAGLSEIELTTEWNLYRFGEEEVRRGASETATDLLRGFLTIPTSVLQVFLFSIIVMVPLTLVLALFSAEVRRALLREVRRAVAIVVVLAAIIIAVRNLNFDNFRATFEPSLGANPEAPGWITDPSAIAAFLIGLLLLSIVAFLAWRLWSKRRRRALRLIALEAQEAIADLQAGADFRNTILKCYFEMCQVLRDERQIERREAVTPREFARNLEAVGLAGAHVTRLTHLFEAVRYGARVPRKAEEDEALACLSAVAELAEAAD